MTDELLRKHREDRKRFYAGCSHLMRPDVHEAGRLYHIEGHPQRKVAVLTSKSHAQIRELILIADAQFDFWRSIGRVMGQD